MKQLLESIVNKFLYEATLYKGNENYSLSYASGEATQGKKITPYPSLLRRIFTNDLQKYRQGRWDAFDANQKIKQQTSTKFDNPTYVRENPDDPHGEQTSSERANSALKNLFKLIALHAQQNYD